MVFNDTVCALYVEHIIPEILNCTQKNGIRFKCTVHFMFICRAICCRKQLNTNRTNRKCVGFIRFRCFFGHNFTRCSIQQVFRLFFFIIKWLFIVSDSVQVHFGARKIQFIGSSDSCKIQIIKVREKCTKINLVIFFLFILLCSTIYVSFFFVWDKLRVGFVCDCCLAEFIVWHIIKYCIADKRNSSTYYIHCWRNIQITWTSTKVTCRTYS